MKTKYLLIVGAGATVCDTIYVPKSKKPPLDKGFFISLHLNNYSELTTVLGYLKKTYDYNPSQIPDRDSLEGVMAIIYADIYNKKLEKDAVGAFRALIKLFNRRMAETTNDLNPTNQFALYRMICYALDGGLSPDEICIITFNQDLQIEKILEKIDNTSRRQRFGRIFNFPYCYSIPDVDNELTNPTGSSVPIFKSGDPDSSFLRVLKLHGSLNWYSVHNTQSVPKRAILNANRKFQITTRRRIAVDMRVKGKKTKYTFPLIIPPVTHKAGIIPNKIGSVWSEAEVALKNAHNIVVFGYSCPEIDFESANLLRRTIRQNSNLAKFNVIDPNPKVFDRYVELTQLDSLFYFRSAKAYLAQAR